MTGDGAGRFLLAVVLAAVAAWAAALLVSTLTVIGYGGAPFAVTWGGVLDVARSWLASVVMLPMALVLTLLAGLPMYLALRRRGVVAYAIGGALAGAVVLTVLGLLRAGYWLWLPAGLGAISGLAAGVVFRKVWRG